MKKKYYLQQTFCYPIYLLMVFKSKYLQLKNIKFYILLFILSMNFIVSRAQNSASCNSYPINYDFTPGSFQLEGYNLQTNILNTFYVNTQGLGSSINQLFVDPENRRNNLWNIDNRRAKYEAILMDITIMGTYDSEIREKFTLDILSSAPPEMKNSPLLNYLLEFTNASVQGTDTFGEIQDKFSPVANTMKTFVEQVDIWLKTPYDKLYLLDTEQVSGIINGPTSNITNNQYLAINKYLTPISKAVSFISVLNSVADISDIFKDAILTSLVKSFLINDYAHNRFIEIQEELKSNPDISNDPALIQAFENVSEFLSASKESEYFTLLKTVLKENAFKLFNNTMTIAQVLAHKSILDLITNLVQTTTHKAVSAGLKSGWAIGIASIAYTINLIVEIEKDWDKIELSVIASTLGYHLCTNSHEDCKITSYSHYAYLRSITYFKESIPNPTFDWVPFVDSNWEVAYSWYETMELNYKYRFNVIYDDCKSKTNQIPLLESPIDIVQSILPKLIFSSFESHNEFIQKGFQINVLNDANEPIYDTGLILNTSGNTHIYKPGEYSGYDIYTKITRISEPLDYGNTYTWKVRYVDTGDDWSNWSDLGSFSVANFNDVFNIEMISPNLSSYGRGQNMNIQWATELSENTEYTITLLKDNTAQKILSTSATGNAYQWSIPSDQSIDNNYTIEVKATSNEAIKDQSSVFEIKEALSGYDLAIVDFKPRDSYFLPNNTISFDYKVRNAGNIDVTNVEVIYNLRDSNTGILIDSNTESISETIQIHQQVSESGSVTAPSVSGFYDLEILLNFDLDYKGGNNLVIYKVYVGDSNPYSTYVRGSNDVEVSIGQSENIAGFNVRVDAADSNTVRVDVEGDNDNYLKQGKIYFLNGEQLGLIYKTKINNKVIFRYYTATTDLSFNPIRFEAQAGKTTTIDYQIIDDDPKQSISFFEEASEIADQQEVVNNWALSSKVTSIQYNEGELNINVPSSANKILQTFWIEVDGSRFIQQLVAEVIDPISDFEPIISSKKITTGPGRTNQLVIGASSLDGFNETILTSVVGQPTGVNLSFQNNNDKEFSVGETILLNISVDPGFTAYGSYSFNINRSSDTKSKTEVINLDIVDSSKNFINITNVEYIDINAKLDTLQINFNTEFSLDPSATTSNWQYNDGTGWQDIPESEITGNNSYSPGAHSVVWNIHSGLAVPDTKFRMKNKNGVDYLSFIESKQMVYNDTFTGFTFNGNYLYIIESSSNYYTNSNENQRYFKIKKFDVNDNFNYIENFKIELPFNSGANSVNERDLKLYIEGNYFFIFYTDENKLWVSQLDKNAGGSNKEVDFLVNGKVLNTPDRIDSFIKIENNLYTIHENDDHNYYLQDINIYGNFVSTQYLFNRSSNIRTVDNAFFDGFFVYFIEDEFIDKYTLEGNLEESTTLSFTSNNNYNIEYFNNKMYSLLRSDKIDVYSFYDPYSFFSESPSFSINTTSLPEFIGQDRVNLIEDQDLLTFQLDALFSDEDTESVNLSFDFINISDGLELIYDGSLPSFTLKPKENIDSDQSFRISVSDGSNTITQEFEVFIESIDDETVAGIKIGQTLSIKEDESILISFDDLFIDIDNETDELELSIEVFLNDGSGQLAGFSPVINLEDKYIQLQANENQNGFFEVQVQVKNTLEDKTSNFSFTLEVIPQNDKPEAFSLLNPLNEYLLPGEVVFNWESTSDVDEDDITYEFYVSIDEIEYTQVINTNQINYTIDQEMIGKSGFWQVVASDGTEDTFPTNNYGVFNVVENSADLYPFDQVVKDDLTFYIDESTSPGTVFVNILNYFPSDLDLLEFSLTPNNVFEIDPNGYLSLISPLSFETQDEYNLPFTIIYNNNEDILYSRDLKIIVNNDNNVSLKLRSYLQGPILNPVTEGLMNDHLRQENNLPVKSPYSDALTVNITVFNTGGSSGNGLPNDDIVDWVWVELRDATDNTVVVSSKSALLQRDGDVVALDGVSNLTIDAAAGNYYVAVNHRNHLGIMSVDPIALSSAITVVDFSSDHTLVLGGTNAVVDIGNNILAEYGGDYDENGQVQNTDLTAIIQLLGIAGYSNADLNLNNQIQNTDINNICILNLGKGQQFTSGSTSNKLNTNNKNISDTRNVNYTLKNGKITPENGKNYYEVDVLIESSEDFKLGSGQLFFNYNTAAFGENISANNKLEFTQPVNYILGELYGFPAYKDFIQNDNISSRFSISYQQGVSSESITADNVLATPKRLFHLKIEYLDVNEKPEISFETKDLFLDQTFTACGSQSAGLPDCINYSGTQLVNDTFDNIVLNVGNEQLENSLLIYPNPVLNILTIDSKTPLSKVEIYSVLGKKVKEINTDFKSIPINNLSNGMYFLKIYSTKDYVVKKILKK